MSGCIITDWSNIIQLFPNTWRPIVMNSYLHPTLECVRIVMLIRLKRFKSEITLGWKIYHSPATPWFIHISIQYKYQTQNIKVTFPMYDNTYTFFESISSYQIKYAAQYFGNDTLSHLPYSWLYSIFVLSLPLIQLLTDYRMRGVKSFIFGLEKRSTYLPHHVSIPT